MSKATFAEIPKPPVKSRCKRCGKVPFARPEDFAVVSPSGVEHIGEDYGDTACGIDATGKNWWWPL